MLIMLVTHDKKTMSELKKYVPLCYPDSDIIAFDDSSEALRYVESDASYVQICFAEVIMPGISGFRITDALKDRNKNTKIVYISDTDSYALDAWEHNVSDYLIKPITHGDVEHSVISCR